MLWPDIAIFRHSHVGWLANAQIRDYNRALPRTQVQG
jgi:hypothetical protein